MRTIIEKNLHFRLRHKGADLTLDYTDTDIDEVAHALEVLTNTLYPLAQANPRVSK